MEIAWARKRWFECGIRGGFNERKAFIEGFLRGLQDWRRNAKALVMKDNDLGLLPVHIPNVSDENVWF